MNCSLQDSQSEKFYFIPARCVVGYFGKHCNMKCQCGDLKGCSMDGTCLGKRLSQKPEPEPEDEGNYSVTSYSKPHQRLNTHIPKSKHIPRYIDFVIFLKYTNLWKVFVLLNIFAVKRYMLLNTKDFPNYKQQLGDLFACSQLNAYFV